MKVYYSPADAPLPSYASHFILERAANIVTGPGGSGARTTEKKEDSMTTSRKKPCANCEREMSIVGEHCCFVCYHAGKGLEGEEKAAALAAVKENIKGGRIYRGRGRSPFRPGLQSAPADPAITPRRRKEPKPPVDKTPASREEDFELSRLITIGFPDECDRKIYDALIGQAARQRRTPEQQILWMLQNAMEYETGLLAEASGR